MSNSSDASISLEELFTPGWDHARDVLVVAGEGDPGLYRALLDVGQARVVEFGTALHGVAPPPAPYVRAETPLELYRAVLAFPGDPPANANVRRQPGARLPDGLIADLTRALRGAVQSHGVFRRTVDRHTPIWAKQGIANLARMAELPTVGALAGSFAGRPCVIVSPGPSLAKNIHLLREVSGRALVMTGSHALAALQTAGVVPDLVVVSDPLYLPRHFAGFDTTAPSSLVFDAVVNPKHYAFPARRIFTFSSHEAVDTWIFGAMGETAELDTGGSVACSELSLAIAMGCDPIALVGQDLALPDGRYYVDSCVDGGARVEASEDGRSFTLVRPVKDPHTDEVELIRHPDELLVPVPAIGGGSVPTSATLYTFLQWFQIAARSTEARVVNCTEGGAHIDGMSHSPFAEFVDALGAEGDLAVDDILDRAAAGLDVTERRGRMRDAVRQMLSGAEESVRAARVCRELAVEALAGGGDLEALSRAEARLSEALGPVAFLAMLGQERIRAAQEKGAVADTLEENLEAAIELHSVVEEAGRTTIAPLRAALDELRD